MLTMDREQAKAARRDRILQAGKQDLVDARRLELAGAQEHDVVVPGPRQEHERLLGRHIGLGLGKARQFAVAAVDRSGHISEAVGAQQLFRGRVVFLERRPKADHLGHVGHHLRHLFHHVLQACVLLRRVDLVEAVVHVGVVGDLMARGDALERRRVLERLARQAEERAAQVLALELLGKQAAVGEFVLGIHFEQ